MTIIIGEFFAVYKKEKELKMEKSKKFFRLCLIYFVLFVGFTLCVKFIDVDAIGPKDSCVGFSHINKFFHEIIGVNFTLYKIIDLAGIIAFFIGLIFTITGLVQWIKRKKILKVDKNILALGIFYFSTFIVYLFFQLVVINNRPVLIDSNLESSFPSSTTVMSITFLLSALYQVDYYIKNVKVKNTLKTIAIIYCLFLLIGRIISGVHWFTDIIGGIIIGTCLLYFYYWLIYFFQEIDKKNKNNA